METPPFLLSLHRPLNKPLIASRWVCKFIAENSSHIPSSELNIQFFMFLIPQLRKQYEKKDLLEYNGVPSRRSVDIVYEHLFTNDTTKIPERVKAILSKDADLRQPFERQVYSTYKAASYYVNMAKDKLRLIEPNNELSTYGINLIKKRSSFFDLSKSEKIFFTERLLEVDFLLLITFCFFKQISIKYKNDNAFDFQSDFLSKFYDLQHFRFTSKSLANYDVVRAYWLETLDILDRRGRFKSTFSQLIKTNKTFAAWFINFEHKINQYENVHFAPKQILQRKTDIFEKIYRDMLKEGRSDLGFVNLHEIRQRMKIGEKTFENFLNQYFNTEKSKKAIFFSNIVSSIDRRVRFKVQSTPVFRIKIKLK